MCGINENPDVIRLAINFKEISENGDGTMSTEEIAKKVEDVMQRAIELGAHLGDVPFDEVLPANGFTEEEIALAIAYAMGQRHEADRQKGAKPQIAWTEVET